MSVVTLQRIRSALLRKYSESIDMSDRAKDAESDREDRLVSRSLACDYIRSQIDCTAKEAAEFVTDGYEDNAIDAFHFHAPSDVLYIVTSRWSRSGKAKIDQAEIAKFASGIQRFLNADLGAFNQKFQDRAAEVHEALYCERQVKISITVVHTGEQPLNGHTMRPLKELADEMNTPIEICTVQQRAQDGVYDMITAHAKDPPVNLQVTLEDWGQITYPYQAYYGKVSTSQVAMWWRDHKDDLFTKNLRLYYPNSVVNRSIRKTVRNEPRDFWYFNNGLTIIAEKIVKGVGGSPKNLFGNFNCTGASIVNGAQTVGAIGAEVEAEAEQEEPAYVHVRLISLESCPPGFSTQITRATNLQNAVGTREFASMDPNQHRLALDFQLDGRKYAYRSGDSEPVPEYGCTLQEATQALGCRLSVGTAVEVKREIGGIWADPQAEPYTLIFPSNLSATTLWRSVRIMRQVDLALQEERVSKSKEPRRAMAATHLNRVVLHVVQNAPLVSEWLTDHSGPDDMPEGVPDLTKEVFVKVLDHIEDKHANAYLGSLAKNTEKCQAIVDHVTSGAVKPSGYPDDLPLFAQMAKEVGSDESDDALDKAFGKLDIKGSK